MESIVILSSVRWLVNEISKTTTTLVTLRRGFNVDGSDWMIRLAVLRAIDRQFVSAATQRACAFSSSFLRIRRVVVTPNPPVPSE